jgi:hypothetical protein
VGDRSEAVTNMAPLLLEEPTELPLWARRAAEDPGIPERWSTSPASE